MKKLTDDQIKTGLYIVGGLIAAVLLFKLGKGLSDLIGGIFTGTGISDTKGAKEAAERTEKAIKDLQKETSKVKPTRTAAQWQFVADNIYKALKYNAASDDKTKAYGELARVLNDADMSLLISGFGKRQEYSFGIPMGDVQTLPQFVKGNFSIEDIDSLNKLYSKSKMTWKF